jgi:phosphoadenosine phosphosulfate reductase
LVSHEHGGVRQKQSPPSANNNSNMPQFPHGAAARLQTGRIHVHTHQTTVIDQLNRELAPLSAEDRVRWTLERFGSGTVMTSSFGVQSATLLHMVVQQKPEIPVVLLDTGYLFKETYQFIDTLTERLNLNLRVYRPTLSAAWQEARHGKLWEQGLPGIEKMNEMNKVEPLKRALSELDANAWLTGLRRTQSESRRNTPVVTEQYGIIKVNPMVDWTDRDLYRYMTRHDLPFHPLWHKGYVSIGDIHTTQRLEPGMREEDSRFFGLKRECGIHENRGPEAPQ